MTHIETYYLDDAASAYHGREVRTVRHGAGLSRVVRVVGTNIEFVTTLWHLAAQQVAA
jgi:hypothetical protein